MSAVPRRSRGRPSVRAFGTPRPQECPVEATPEPSDPLAVIALVAEEHRQAGLESLPLQPAGRRPADPRAASLDKSAPAGWDDVDRRRRTGRTGGLGVAGGDAGPSIGPRHVAGQPPPAGDVYHLDRATCFAEIRIASHASASSAYTALLGRATVSVILGIAENLHDSCVSFIVDGKVAIHLEVERVLRTKRAVFSTGAQVAAIASWLQARRALPDPDAIAVVRHAVEPLTEDAILGLRSRYPKAQVRDFEHLDCHAALAELSGLPTAHVLALDGGGDRRVEWGQPNALVRHWRPGTWEAPRLLSSAQLGIDGRAWAILSFALFGDVHAAGKVMGLAAYGGPDDSANERVHKLIAESLDWRYDQAALVGMVVNLQLQGFDDRANVAFALQEQFSRALRDFVSSELPPQTPLVMTGGCALNVTTNTVLAASAPTRSVWVPPCPGDEGISLGAAVLGAMELGESVTSPGLPYLGIGRESTVADCDIRSAAEHLARGKVIAIAVDRGEVGPRALGHRSFLALPTVSNKRRVSETMKRREHFRPVAPALRADDAQLWLEAPIDSPFMSFASPATALLREACPGVVHVDGSARHQSVTHAVHPTLARLLDDLASLGVPPVVINTSLNIAGSPISLDESDALATALLAGADGLLADGGFVDLRSP